MKRDARLKEVFFPAFSQVSLFVFKLSSYVTALVYFLELYTEVML